MYFLGFFFSVIFHSSIYVKFVYQRPRGQQSNVYSYGNYYAWPAAIASTANYSTNNQVVSASICPSGWRLPTGGSSNVASDSDYWQLSLKLMNGVEPNAIVSTNGLNYYDDTIQNSSGKTLSLAYASYPNNIIYSGGFYDSVQEKAGDNARIWTSTVYGANHATGLGVSATIVYPGNFGTIKYSGRSVRCIARDAFTVSYDANGGSGTMEEQSALVGNTITLPDSTFTAPDGKSFIGWNTIADGSGTSYRPGDTLTDADTTNHALTLYAQYSKTILNIDTMQDMTAEICANTPTPPASETDIPQKQLTDRRDGKSYFVAKLADGKCWMTQNLDFNLDSSVALTSDTTDLTAGRIWTPERNTQTAVNGTIWNAISAHSLDIGEVYYSNGRGDPNNDYAPESTGDPHYSLGNYYNWYGVTAGTGLSTMASGNASDSICPKGWRLPNGGTNSDFVNLTSVYGITNDAAGENKLLAAPFYAVLAGYLNVNNGYFNAHGVRGYYWTNTPYDSTQIYDLVIGSGVRPNLNSNRSQGLNARCLARDNYTVVYDANGGSGTIPSQLINSGTTTALSANAFTAPSGKSFTGWNTEPDGSGTTYTDEQEITDLAASGETITLYAEWRKLITLEMAYENAGKTKLNGYYTMQDMTPEICNVTGVLDEGSQMQVRDIRDNKLYWVTKLQDGHCWMTQNLDHDIDSSKTYTPNDTDIPANWTPDKSTYATSTTTWDTTANGYNIQQSYDPGNKIWDGVPTSSTSQILDNMTQGTNIHYHIGNYYNWSAAVAMNDTSSYTTQYQDVNQSICPAGWTLPKGGDNTAEGSFSYLLSQYNIATGSTKKIWDSPLYFPLAGYWFGSSYFVGYGGNFWSPVVNSSNFAYYLYVVYNGEVSLASYSYNYRYRGYSVRCIAR